MLEGTATTRYEANPAPGDLALLQDLVNTVSVGPGADLLGSTDSATTWLASIGTGTGAGVDVDSLERLRRLRTALRRLLGDGPAEHHQPVDLALRLRLDDDGITVPHGGGDFIEAKVAVALLEGRATGALSRLKLCANPDCQVAFFDQSKNGAAKWHSSARCGNAARVRAHRDRTISRTDTNSSTS